MISARRPIIASLAVMIVAAGLVGCNRVQYSANQEAKYIKPTVAVLTFENKAPIQMKWDLGDGLADQLVDRLLHTRRYVVLERQQLAAILTELRRDQNSRGRQAGQRASGPLKQVRYLVKGKITDFGHVETVQGFRRLFDWGSWGSSSYATVAATVYVIDVQSGQVIASRSVEAKVGDKRKKDQPVSYDGMAFGGYTFYQTPLGRATNEVLDKAVTAIAEAISEQPFQPKVASVMNGRVVINGGNDRRIAIGQEYVVRPEAQVVIDPDTGDLLGHITGETLGRVRVVQVTSKFSVAEIVEGGGFGAGQTLFPVAADVAGAPVSPSSY